jgi:hypothetical protein
LNGRATVEAQRLDPLSLPITNSLPENFTY